MATVTHTPLFTFSIDDFPYAYLEGVVPIEEDGKQGGYARVRFLNDEVLKEVSAKELKNMPARTGNHYEARHLLLPAACCEELKLVNVTKMLVTNELTYTAFDLVPFRYSVMHEKLESKMHKKMYQLYRRAFTAETETVEQTSDERILPNLNSQQVYSCCVIL